MLKSLSLIFAMIPLAVAVPAGAASPVAKPVTDCPLRDAPFSVDLPLVDVLLSDAARAVVARHNPNMGKSPRGINMGTQAPTFAAILSVRSAARFSGMSDAALAAADTELRALPVTEADKVARCARYDNDRPVFNLPRTKPRLLLFEKINGYRDGPSVDAARAAITAMAERKGWAIAITDKGGAFNPATLKQFDAVIWNNISGDVLTLSQRRAFQRYLQQGGGFMAMHGSAGDPTYFWDWYPNTLIGARFLAHPSDPQFQDARIAVNTSHPLAKGLPESWTMNDEWYSFRTNPRSVGAQILLTLDESSYTPVGMMGLDLRMGDHPLAWTNCIGRGRMFYSAIGHRPETYVQPDHVTLLESGIAWAATAKRACPAGKAR